MDKIIRNRILALPFGAELKLNIPETSINSLMQDCLDLSYIEEPTISLHDGYFTFTGNISMVVTSVRVSLALEVRDVIYNGNKFIINFKDHGDTLLSVTKILTFLGSMFSKMITVEGKVIRIDLTSKLANYLDRQSSPMQDIIKSLRIEKPEFTKGNIKITICRDIIGYIRTSFIIFKTLLS
jgi:hypothetical protein